MPNPEFDPRRAALQYAAAVEAAGRGDWPGEERARIFSDALHAVVSGLVYIGDRLAGPKVPTASKTVKVVGVTQRAVLLEVDGEERQLFAGDTVTVAGLSITEAKHG